MNHTKKELLQTTMQFPRQVSVIQLLNDEHIVPGLYHLAISCDTAPRLTRGVLMYKW